MKYPEIGKEYYGIVYQEQPTPYSCVTTCLAMVLGADAVELVTALGDSGRNQEWLQMKLTEYGFCWNFCTISNFVFDSWYFINVPSLNIVGTGHQVLAHWSKEEGLMLLDPSPKKKYGLYGVNLKSFSNLTPFVAASGKFSS